MESALFAFSSHELAIISVASSADGKCAVTSSMDGFLRTYDIVTGEKKLQIDGGFSGSWCVAHHPTAAVFASGNKDGTVVAYNSENGEKKQEFESKEGKFCMSVEYAPSGKLLAAGDTTGLIQLMDTTTGQVLVSYDSV